MKTLGKALGSAAFALVYLFLLAAGAVVAEPPPLPKITFFQGEAEVDSRTMTKAEHTVDMKFQHAMGILDPEQTAEQLTQASLELAARSLGAAADEIKIGNNDDGSFNINADISIESLSEAVSEGGLELGKYAERLSKASENLKQEITANSGDLEFDSIAIGEDSKNFRLNME
jgi:hypothetical protein